MIQTVIGVGEITVCRDHLHFVYKVLTVTDKRNINYYIK